MIHSFCNYSFFFFRGRNSFEFVGIFIGRSEIKRCPPPWSILTRRGRIERFFPFPLVRVIYAIDDDLKVPSFVLNPIFKFR